MIVIRRLFLGFLLATALAEPVRPCLAGGQSPSTLPATLPTISRAAPVPLDPALAQFVTAGTLIVARVDTSRLDAVVLHAWLTNPAGTNPQAVKQLAQWLDPFEPQAKEWLDGFHDAGGGIIYGVANFGDPADVPGVLIVPLNTIANTPADARAIAGLLVSGRPDGADHRLFGGGGDPDNGSEAIVLHNAVVFGLNPQVERMKSARPVERPEFAAGMAALGNAPLEIVASPSEAIRIAGVEIFPETLPDAAGGGSPMGLVNPLVWAGISITPPPDAAIHFTIRCTSTAAIQNYLPVCDALLGALADEPTSTAKMSNKDRFLAAIKPTWDGDRLELDLGGSKLNDLVRPELTNLLTPDDRPEQPATRADH